MSCLLSARSLGGSGYVWFPFSPSLSSHLSPSLIPLLLSLSLSFLQYTSTLGQAFALCDSSRNVPDDVLRNVTTNRGLVMVNFYANFICCQDTCALADVARHIVHIRDVSGIDHVGIGGDYDGVDKLPTGLEDVSKYPDLMAHLIRNHSFSEDDIAKLSGGNLLRVLGEAEAIGARLRSTAGPDQTLLTAADFRSSLKVLSGETVVDIGEGKAATFSATNQTCRPSTAGGSEEPGRWSRYTEQ